ncbi:MAG: carboxypeptidase-like regulatory domain-containing protein [Winogradskyella sp.]|uniref:carboxypeptidase-like regulatory domain-containing protein n=1 Tax=Winogradskyella sp. TaxID=1883156 RepID=UPI003859C3F6
MKYLLFIATLVISHCLFSQTITGKIVDSENNPIPYVTLQIGANYGVITNDEGVFNLEVDNFSETDIVSISCLGYKSVDYKLSDFNKEIYRLEASISELSEVFVTNKQLSVAEILEKVRANSSENYAKEGAQRVFSRSTSNFELRDFDFDLVKSSNLKKSKIKTFNKEFEDLKGNVVSKKSRYYEDVLVDLLKTSDSLQMAVIKATKLINEDKDLSTNSMNSKAIENAFALLDSSATYKLKSGFFKLEDSLKIGDMIQDSTKSNKGDTKGLKSQIARIIRNNTVSEDSKLEFIFEEDDYEHTIEGITNIDDETAYIISFKPDKFSATYSGKMYVNTSDFAVVKLEYQYAENKIGQRVSLKFLMGIKYEENAYRATVIFKKNNNEKYSPYFISQESGNYVFLDRSLKFTRNNTSEQRGKQVLKLKLMVEQDFNSKTELYFINNLDSENLVLEYKKEYPIVSLKQYDASIWKDYNVLTPVQAIIDYDKE